MGMEARGLGDGGTWREGGGLSEGGGLTVKGDISRWGFEGSELLGMSASILGS